MRPLLLLLLHGTACSTSSKNPDSNDGDVVIVAGPTSYWNADQVLTPSGSLASAIITWPDVRLVRSPALGEGHQLVRPTRNSCNPSSELGDPFPVAVGAGIIGGRERLVVADGACGVWIADLQQLSETIAWNSIYEEVSPNFTISVEDADGDGIDDVLLAGVNGFVLCQQTDTMHCRPFPSLASLVSRPAMLLHGVFGVEHAILYQRNGAPELVPVNAASEELGPPLSIEQRPTEYLKPFEQFDQLAGIALPNCDAFGIGIGTFDQSARFSTRRPQILSMTGPAEFQASTLPTAMDVVAAMGVVQDSTERAIVVVLGRRDGTWALEAGAAKCDGYEPLIDSAIDFDWAVPLSPTPSTDPYLPHLGLKIVAEPLSSDRIGVYHSDGFTLRTLDLDLAAGSVTQTNFAVP